MKEEGDANSRCYHTVFRLTAIISWYTKGIYTKHENTGARMDTRHSGGQMTITKQANMIQKQWANNADADYR